MKKVFAVTAALALLGLGIAAQADVFNLGTGFTNLETVTVGDPGNAGDFRYGTAYQGSEGGPASFGSVGYNYNIGKYEVTAKQYADFLNNKASASDPYGLYNTSMDTANNPNGCNIKRASVSGNYTYTVADDWANRPVNYIDFWDALRFANWLNNGQGNGDTETGAYTLGGYNGPDGLTIQRNAGARWFLTNEDEWYKAAYYKGGGTDAGYWDYPTQSDTEPSNVGSDGYADPGNHANYEINSNYTIGSPYYRTNVGEFEKSASAYGTFDQGGNVFEWNEGIDGTIRVERGGAANDGGHSAYHLRAAYRGENRPDNGGPIHGFRIAGVPAGWEPVPEPSSIIALAGALISLLGIRRRRA